MKESLNSLITHSLKSLNLSDVDFSIEHPENLEFGDYSTNVAMVLARENKANPKEIAEKIKAEVEATKQEIIEKVEIAGPGFINFFLKSDFFEQEIKNVLLKGRDYGKSSSLNNKKIIVEYTDLNPFKEFHIGHLMSNSLGEVVARLFEWSGAEVKRAIYQSDVGMHVASSIAHKIHTGANWITVQDIAVSYAEGSKLLQSDEEFKKLVIEVNKKVYEKSDEEINKIYEIGRKISLDSFEEIYKKLGTTFDFYFFESNTAEVGKKIVLDKIGVVFEESDGAVVYKGENRDKTLHTRVFLNKEGLPTYEAKDLGLALTKKEVYDYDKSLIVTANEQNEYFRVVLSAMKEIFPELAEKTIHISHGIMKLPTGKMSSRTGQVITAEALINTVSEKILERMQSTSKDITDKDKLSEEIAVGAIKYGILKQSPGKDIIFDLEKATSFEGDSGPYLAYTHARANSIAEKAGEAGISTWEVNEDEKIFDIEKYLYRFPEIVKRAQETLSPNIVVTFLTELSAEFNKFYAENKIVDEADPLSPKKVAITHAVRQILSNGLDILAIKAPEKM